jgi:hypothetical protein
MLRYHYEKLAEGYVEGLREAAARGEIGELDAEVTSYALMGMGELIGMRWILWNEQRALPQHVLDELARIIRCVLEARP